MAGIVHVIVFTNFEGWDIEPEAAERAVTWFDDCFAEHSEIRWTHLYSRWREIRNCCYLRYLG